MLAVITSFFLTAGERTEQVFEVEIEDPVLLDLEGDQFELLGVELIADRVLQFKGVSGAFGDFNAVGEL